MFTSNVVDVLRRSVHVLVGISYSSVGSGIFPLQICHLKVKFVISLSLYIPTCVYILLCNSYNNLHGVVKDGQFILQICA